MQLFCICRIEVGKNKSISIPVEETNDEVMRQLKQKIALGTYKVGNLIVPQVFEKVAIRDGRIAYEKVTIVGRKIPLVEIRKELLEKNNKYMRLRTNDEFEQLSKDNLIISLKQINEFTCTDQCLNSEALIEKLKKFERTRHLMMWHDCATVGGHSYLLMMIACMYDPACYLTDTEYERKYNISSNVQAIVEKPRIYILAQCPSNDQQILYSQERLEDIIALNKKIKTKNNIEITDKLRIFKGDKPAAQFEAGQQKGGNFDCFSCGTHAEIACSYVHTHSLAIETIHDRVNQVMKTELSLSKSN